MPSSSNSDHLTNLLQPRNQTLGLNLSAKQAVTVPSNLKAECVIIPPTSQPQFGSYFIFDIKETNTIISDFIINFNLSASTGVYGAPANYPHFSPATFWLFKVELVVNNVTIVTLYPVVNFIAQQFFMRMRIDY